MKNVISIFFMFLFPAVANADVVIPANAADEPETPVLVKTNVKKNEIKVTLFGQLCFMTGPFDIASLNAIHSISPEKMPAPINVHQARQLLERVTRTPKLPPAFDTYRERLEKFLASQKNVPAGSGKKNAPSKQPPKASDEETATEIPEEDFHRAARKSGVEYTCAFGEQE